jgi:hypothetical protein
MTNEDLNFDARDFSFSELGLKLGGYMKFSVSEIKTKHCQLFTVPCFYLIQSVTAYVICIKYIRTEMILLVLNTII